MTENQQGNTPVETPQNPVPMNANPAPVNADPASNIAGNPMQAAGVPNAPQSAPQTADSNPNLSTSGLAVAGMVIGIVGIATSLMPIINNISFFVGAVGFVLAIIGLVGINKGKNKGRGFAITGIVLNILTVVLVLASQAFYGSVLDSVSDSLKATPASSATQAASSDNGGSAGSDAAGSNATATAADSAYVVTIDSARKVTDYEGKPAVVVTFTFTNNSTDDTSFMVAMSDKVFQNGVQLESAIGSSWDSSNYMKTIKTGTTIQVEQGFELIDQTSPVTVEVSELWDFSDELIAEETFDLPA